MCNLEIASNKYRRADGHGHGEAVVIYGVPLYRPIGYTASYRIPFVKVHLHNDVVVNAYRYLVYKFSQYAYLNEGFVIKNYDPSTGIVEVELPRDVEVSSPIGVEELVKRLYEEFAESYLAPKLLSKIRKSSLDKVLSVFYRKAGEGKGTGLSTVVLPAKYVDSYINEIAFNEKYAVQLRSRKSILKDQGKILQELQSLSLGGDDLVVVEKGGRVRRLSEEDVKNSLKLLPPRVSTTIDVKSIRGEERCCYCGSKIVGQRFSNTGKLGIGRYRLPHEDKTDFSKEGSICLRCVLIAMHYVLDDGERVLFYTFNGLLGAIRFEGRIVKGTTTDLATSIAKEIGRNVPKELATAIVLNSAFGEERARVNVEGLDEVALERIALLSILFYPQVLYDEGVQRILLNYSRGDFPSFITYLSYILKRSEKLKQSEKGGGRMSYVSKEVHKYITPHIYRELETRVAYAIAFIAESVVYQLQSSGADRYTIRKFADTLRSGLCTAIAYALPRIGKELKSLRLSDVADKTMIKEVLERYGFQYEEKEGALYVYLSSIPSAEIRIREEHGTKVLLKAYDILTLLAPAIVVEEKTEQAGGEESVQQKG